MAVPAVEPAAPIQEQQTEETTIQGEPIIPAGPEEPILPTRGIDDPTFGQTLTPIEPTQ